MLSMNSSIKVHHGGGHDGIGGPVVKLARMQKYFPDIKENFDLVYTIHGTVNEKECRIANKSKIPVICHVNSCWHPAYNKNYKKRN